MGNIKSKNKLKNKTKNKEEKIIKNNNNSSNVIAPKQEVNLLISNKSKICELKNNNNLSQLGPNDNYIIENIQKDNKSTSKPPNLMPSSILIDDSYSNYCTDNSFAVINSFDKILYLIYATKTKSIISFDIINNQKLNEVKNAHKDYISVFSYCLDKINKRELILSVSPSDRNIKLWKINNLECLFNFTDIYKDGILRTSCFLNYNNKLYIVTCHFKMTKNKPIKVFDLNGKQIKKINDSKADTFVIDTYFDEKKSESYIITANRGYLISYNYNKNKKYHVYDSYDFLSHYSFLITNNDGILKLIESSEKGIIRIWDFHSGILLKRFEVFKDWLHGICLWENDLLLIGCFNKTIILIELKTGKTIKNFRAHNNLVLTLKKINHPKLGICLISQCWLSDRIIIWKNIN